MKKNLESLRRRIFPSHVSAKEFLRFAFGCVGLDVRIRGADRVRGWNLLDDITALIPKASPQIVFDVGAHHGESLFKIYNLLRGPIVHSFEPSPGSFGVLKQKFSDRPNLRLNNLALGDSTGAAAFHEYEGSPFNSALPVDRTASNVSRDVRLLQTVTVQMDTVDAYCAREGIERIDWLKIDSQGYDLHVLKGARQMLADRRIALVTLEVNFLPMYEGEGSFCDILHYLEPLGCHLVDFYDKNYVDRRLSCCDLLFVRDGGTPNLTSSGN